ncbi:hypothetical protein B0H14DRAFT_2995976, partial [Mycena olivaceomarginata]
WCLVHHINGNLDGKVLLHRLPSRVVAILNITPYAAGQFGYYYGTCWFNDPRPDVQFRWLLGSQSFVFFFMILAYICASPRGMSTSSTSFIFYNVRAFNTALGLYPLLSCCLSFTGCIVDIWLTKNPDPPKLGFLRALRALRNHSKSKHSTALPVVASTRTPTARPCTCNWGRRTKSTTWGGEESNQSRSFEEQSVVSHGGAGGARRKPSFSMLSLVDREAEGGEELDVEAQTRSRAEDIARQI